jgi:hypothetical protein
MPKRRTPTDPAAAAAALFRRAAASAPADTTAPATPAAPDPATAPAADTDPAADAPGFTPVPVRPRADGWTPERQQRFIEALADTGSVQIASLGNGMSAESAYRLRRRPGGEAFDAAWDAAMAVATRRLADAAFERALEGVEQPVFWKGDVVGTRRQPSDRLLMFLLKHHDPLTYGNLAGPMPYDATLADPRGPRIRRFPALLARLIGRAEPAEGGRPTRDAPSSTRT